MSKIKIAVVDDRKDARQLVASVIDDVLTNLNIKDQWAVLETAPFPNLEKYPDWVNRENIGVLLVDERLDEISDRAGKTAKYTGSDLVNLLRRRFKDLPIYGVTSYPDDATLQHHFALFNEVIKRDVFTSKARQYVERFLRTYKAFLEAHENELAELTSLSKRIAMGKASTSDKKRADAIQKNLEIPVTTDAIVGRKDLLNEFQKVVREFEAAQKEVDVYLKKQGMQKKK